MRGECKTCGRLLWDSLSITGKAEKACVQVQTGILSLLKYSRNCTEEIEKKNKESAKTSKKQQ